MSSKVKSLCVDCRQAKGMGIVRKGVPGLPNGPLCSKCYETDLQRRDKEIATRQALAANCRDLPHDGYAALGLEVGKLVDKKQAAYGDSFGRSGAVLRALYPDGMRPEQYDDLLAIARIVDKLFRIATHGEKDLMGESPYRDICGYGLLGAARHERSRQ